MSEPGRPKCPVCGRLFWCDYPNKWVYKRGTVFLCSWGCLRKYDKGKEAKEMILLTEAQKKKAISIAKSGESPYKYLKGLGVANPTTSWKSILNWARNKLDRNELEELPESFGQPKKAEAPAPEPEKEWTPAEEVYTKEEPEKPTVKTTVELVYDPSIAEEYRKEHPELYPQPEEKVKAVEPLPIASVWSRVIDTGTYRKVNGVGMMLELGPLRDGPLMLSAEDWRKFAEEIGIALEMLKADETVEV